MYQVNPAFRLSVQSARMTVLISSLFLGLVPVTTLGLNACQGGQGCTADQDATEIQRTSAVSQKEDFRQ